MWGVGQSWWEKWVNFQRESSNHTEQACDRYIKAYKKVEKLNRTMKSEEIAQILGMGKSLVEEYIRILNEEGD